MASGLSSPTGIAGILLVVIGLIMAVVGVIFLIAGQSGSWWTWLLFIGGIILVIIGAILIAVALASSSTISACTPQPAAQIVYAPAPAPAPIPVVQPQPQQVVYHSPAPQQVVYHSPAPQAPVVAPPPQVSTHSYQIGQEHFDPDPQIVQTTATTVSPPTPRRTVVQGPYGPQGQMIQVSGTYTPPAVATQTTTTSQYDIANHPVVSVPARAASPARAPAAVPQQQYIAPAGFAQIPAGTYQVQRTSPVETVNVQRPVMVAAV